MPRQRQKRRLSSELDPRWGDPAISSPNAGSWSQRGGASPRASPVSAHSSHHGRSRSRSRGEPSEKHKPANEHQGKRKVSVDSSPTIPTGYYDAKLRRRPKTAPRLPKSQSAQPAEIRLPKAWEERRFGGSSADEAEDNIPDLGSTRGKASADDASRGSKSPPLSVTSRMRRFSGQSTVTDPIFSIPGTASTQRTSFGLDDTRFARHSPHPDKKPFPRAQIRDAGPIPAAQELVPSYDDLYG
ncbi:hypothetical protein BJX61DRAFT_538292 [Aspergillus egyptiacus]|nr:hypothetical protein BJX61DRAFT_538292 [Aspergillus egyptiacus]